MSLKRKIKDHLEQYSWWWSLMNAKRALVNRILYGPLDERRPPRVVVRWEVRSEQRANSTSSDPGLLE